MAINQLQRDAYMGSKSFADQVHGIVTQEAMYKAQTWANMYDALYQSLSSVARSPSSYEFVRTIVSDTAWNDGYDVWAANPTGLTETIRTAVNTWWKFCTGIVNAPPEPQMLTVETVETNSKGETIETVEIVEGSSDG